MGCVHADGGNPRYVCNTCEKDEPGLRARNRGWVRGDVVPEVHGTETGRFKTASPNVSQASKMATPICRGCLVGGDAQHVCDPYKSTEYVRGSQDMLDMIRGSLKGYPDAGGDIGVMRSVDSIVENALHECKKLNRSLQEEIQKLRGVLGAIQDSVEEVI